MNKSKGFTLIEIAIVLTIIGILLGAIMLRSGSVIGNAKTTDTLALIKDLSAAINDFKNRYHYLPGDMPKAGDDLSGTLGLVEYTQAFMDALNNLKDETDCGFSSDAMGFWKSAIQQTTSSQSPDTAQQKF